MDISEPMLHADCEIREWLKSLFELSNLSKCTEIVVAIWAIWYSRNIYYHEGIKQSTHEIVNFILSYLLELPSKSQRI